MGDLNKFSSTYGKLGILRFGLYPITLLITSPFVLLASVFLSIKKFISRGSNSRFKHFHLTQALNTYFYSARAWNLKKYGRKGKTDFLGLGNYYLARCFNYSKFSLFTYWKYGALTVFLGMFLWAASFLFFPIKNTFFVICIALCICSSLFHANIFRSQNYNVIGWIFFPIAIIGMIEGEPMWVALALLLASFGSFTVVILGTILSGIWGMIHLDFLMIFSGLPASIKLAFHFYPFLSLGKNKSKEILSKVLKAIGANDNARYKRKKAKSFDLIKVYLLLLQMQFVGAFFLLEKEAPILFLICMGIYLVNALKIRFADDQSIYMLILSVATITTLYSQNYWMLPSLWLCISPLPLLVGYHQMKKLDVLPVLSPIDMQNIETDFSNFLSLVPENSRILMAFEDPGDTYEKVFQGFRNYIEMPIFQAMQKNIRLFPDWWAVFELNYPDATDIWGVDTKRITANMQEWDCEYVISYSNNEKGEDPILNDNNYKILGTFSWNDHDDLFGTYPNLRSEGLRWHLLKKII